MQINRFFGDFDLTKKYIRIKDEAIFRQVRSVLRLGSGGRFILCDGDLNEAEVKIVEFKEGVVEVEVINRGKNEKEPNIYAILYCSILKRSNFELVVQKATEVGVSEVVPLICRHTVKLKVRPERLEKIIREAAEQAGRGIVPKLYNPIKFSEAVKEAKEHDNNYFFDVSGEHLKGNGINTAGNSDGRRVGIWIGPEGGWDDNEVLLAKSKSFKILNLGDFTLRAETAAVISSYLITQFSLS
ncbi:16S rRNA (uracil(1498)-N(3))-methyltransferase [Candidatus Dojkabacteria bacterium]|nr:16S rRNA (uracil(1498)-N(3))-methyltransferase [Candidatus Dojkabacteria bacterium]